MSWSLPPRTMRDSDELVYGVSVATDITMPEARSLLQALDYQELTFVLTQLALLESGELQERLGARDKLNRLVERRWLLTTPRRRVVKEEVVYPNPAFL